MIFTNDRHQLRKFFFNAWQKYKNNQILEKLEEDVVKIILTHPEYHFIFENLEKYIDRDYFPELTEPNPFLHMALHLSIREQINTNRPFGINHVYLQLMNKFGDELRTEHIMMECLAECIWHAQRYNQPLEEQVYLDSLYSLLDQPKY